MLRFAIATSCTAATKLLPLTTAKYTCRSPHDCVPSKAGTQYHVTAVTIGPATKVGVIAVRRSGKGAELRILSVVVRLKTESVLAPELIPFDCSTTSRSFGKFQAQSR